MGLLDDELLKAAFGVFPQMQPRRRFQDPVGAANVPLDVTRGRLAGLLGLLPDALNFMGRSPMPTEMFGETQYEPTPQMPYGSEYYLQNLPLKPTSRIGEVAGQAGAFVPLNPMPAAKAVAAGARALGPTAVGMGERYLQRQGLMPGVVEGESAGLLGGPIKPQAPVSELGFYSAAEQTALNIPRKSGTGESFLNDLMKGQDVKKDELSWIGLDDYLKGKPNVTRQEVQDFIASNRVDVQERQLGAAVAEDPVGIAQRKAVFDKYEPQIQALYKDMDSFGYDTPPAVLQSTDNRLRKLQEMRDAEADAFYKIPEPTPTRYQNYQLPGGENYREILLTLPANASKAEQTYMRLGDLARPLTELEQLEFRNARDAFLKQTTESSQTYRSSHFNEPNILAHMRVNDRVDADGKKMLLIEEIQSDWHQAGREKGYAGNYAKGDVKPYTPERAKAEFGLPNNDLFWYFEVPGNTLQIPKSRFGTQDEAMNYVLTEKKVNPEGVPDAPFKDTWHQLALKRALKYAADNGYDRVGLTTGRQQAERYNLAKQVDYIDYVREGPDKYRMAVVGKDGQGVNLPKDIFSEVELKSYLGNDVAKRIVNGEGQSGGGRMTLRGPDLQVGGEGMKKYYDEIYPAFLAKQGKKYNAKTGETRIKTGKNLQDEDFVGAEQRILEALGDYGERGYKTTDNRFFDTYADAVSHEKKISSKDPFDAPIRYIDISPEMRGGIKKGQPLFTAAPIGGIGLGAGTQDNEMPDAVRQYMANPTLGLLQDEEERKKLGGLLYR